MDRTLQQPLRTSRSVRLPGTAFTLVETLVVLALIAIIAAIIIPVVGRVRSNARATQCLSNIRQWGVATQLYVSDHAGYFPRTAWDSYGNYAQYRLLEYILPNAPSSRAEQWTIIHDDYDCPDGVWIYGFNSFLSEQPANAITQPSSQILATDSANGWLDNGAIKGWNSYLKKVPKPHSGKVSVLHVDGSVSLENVSALVYADATRDTSFYQESHETQFFSTETRNTISERFYF